MSVSLCIFKDVVFLAQQKRQSVNHTDRRVKRTKKALRDALFELLENKGINQITVTELTTLADVNRATFYFYYTDLIDMLQQIQNEAFEAFKNVIQKSTLYYSTVFFVCKGVLGNWAEDFPIK